MTTDAGEAGRRRRLGPMREAYARLSAGGRKAATAAALLLVAGVAYHVVFGANGLTVYEQKRQETRRLDAQMQELQRENELLKGHVESLERDPSAIEHQAREEFRYARPGELIYALPDR
jgi:cell division protein FtsB